MLTQKNNQHYQYLTEINLPDIRYLFVFSWIIGETFVPGGIYSARLSAVIRKAAFRLFFGPHGHRH